MDIFLFSGMISYFDSSASAKLIAVDRLIVLVALLELLAEFFVIQSLKFSLKCLPIFGLIFIALKSKTEGKAKYSNRLALALTFGAIGDFFLLFQPFELFLIGMLSFLISHLFYISVLRLKLTSENRQLFQSKNIIIGITIIWILTIINAIFVWEKLPSKIGVSAYGIVLTTMISITFTRYKTVPSKSYWPVLVGGVLFGISDNIIAITKFNNLSNRYTDVVIMATYYLSQYFLCHGILVAIRSLPKQK